MPGTVRDSPPKKHRDQQFLLILISEATPPGTPGRAGIIHFSSTGIVRVCHSSFDIESVAGVSCLDVLLNVNRLLGDAELGICPHFRDSEKRLQWESKLCSTELHSDANSFVKVCRSGTAHILNRRRASDVEDVMLTGTAREHHPRDPPHQVPFTCTWCPTRPAPAPPA